MGLINYLTQIIVSIGIFLILCFLGEQLKKLVKKYSLKLLNPNEFFPDEEILSLKQVNYLLLILVIYVCIINVFYEIFYTVSPEILLINSIIDIFVSLYVVMTFYDSSKRSKILILFLMPLASISTIIFGGTLLEFWDFIRIPALLYVVVYSYRKFLEFTEENNLEKLILLLVSIIFTCLLFTILLENQNPINSLAMVSNAFTSNGYAILGDSVGGVLTSTLLVWSGYIISGVATATLAAAIVNRNSKKKYKNLEDKIDNLEKLIVQYQDENKGEDK